MEAGSQAQNLQVVRCSSCLSNHLWPIEHMSVVSSRLPCRYDRVASERRRVSMIGYWLSLLCFNLISEDNVKALDRNGILSMDFVQPNV